MSMIEFSMQLGDTYSDKLIGPMHILLNKIFLFDEDMTGYFEKLKFFSIIFRVAGTMNDFDGGDGCEFLKKVRGKDCITIDYVISQSKWQSYCTPVKAKVVDKVIRYDFTPEQQNEFRVYVADAVRECFVLLKEKAKKLKHKMNKNWMRTLMPVLKPSAKAGGFFLLPFTVCGLF